MPDIIWTNHVTRRTTERKITTSQVNTTINSPDKSSVVGDRIQFVKKFGEQIVTAIVKVNDEGEYIILSAWIDPPNPGTSDFKKNARFSQMRKASPIKKIWLTFLNQLGL